MRPKTVWLDCETSSVCDLKKHALHRYAEHPTTSIQLLALAIDYGPVEVIDLANGDKIPGEFKEALGDSSTVVAAHNSAFDRTVLRETKTLDIPLSRWRCTMAQALSHGLPGALDNLGAALGLPPDVAKLKIGRQLMALFCKPNKEGGWNTSKTHPKEWEAYKEYAKQDVIAMRECAKRMPKWNYPNLESEWIYWLMDQRCNDRGMPIDTELVSAAIATVEEEKIRLAKEISSQTQGAIDSATRRDALREHILKVYGITLPDMQKDTLERRLDDPELPDEVKAVLQNRLLASSTSTSKYQRVYDAVNADDRLRGCIQYCAAARTGRDGGRVFQPQNLPRPDPILAKQLDQGIEAIKQDAAQIIYGDKVMSLASTAIRSVISAPPGKKLVIADLAGIEGRVLAWLAGEEWKLQSFRDYDKGIGYDSYTMAYAMSFGVDPKIVSENKKHGDGMMRQIGKVEDLMLGYQGGVGAFLTGAAAYRIDLEAMAQGALPTIPERIRLQAEQYHDYRIEHDETTYDLSRDVFIACDSIKRLWRDAHPAIVSFWSELEKSVINALHRPGEYCQAGKHIGATYSGKWLRIILPSGRALCYPGMAQVEDGVLSFYGVDQYSKKWQRIKTYSGKLAENVTQAVSRDVFKHGQLLAEKRGFEIVLPVHDELVAEVAVDGGLGIDDLKACMTKKPSWAEGLPLAAAGFESQRYRKD